MEYIGFLEDHYLAEARARRNHEAIPLVEVERKLGRLLERHMRIEDEYGCLKRKGT